MSLRRRTAAIGLVVVITMLFALVGLAPLAGAQSGDDPCLDNIPEQIPIEDLSLDPELDGLGGTLPSVLDSDQVAGILAEVYAPIARRER